MTKLITVKGAVQGVGYRPFIAEKATEYHLVGNVKNIGAAVEILVSGTESDIASFLCCVENECPPGGKVISVTVKDVESENESNNQSFEIIDSKEIKLSDEIPVFLPDIGICEDCTKELLDPENRRYHHPLISCAVCGPRFSIINKLPYDRDTTTQDKFEMCPECKKEYSKGRRRYAQTISCHDCGPQMKYAYKNEAGEEIEAQKEEAISIAINDLKEGKIIALKGISGYQLVCVPKEEPARALRQLKGRENKPFAVMFSDTSTIREYACMNDLECSLLESSPRPIVLLKKKYAFSDEVDRGSRYIGAFLPSAGIQRMLCDEVGPIIATSANYSSEPMMCRDKDVFDSFMKNPILRGVLYHDREINLSQDDSVMFVINGKNGESAQFIRRARGYAPLPFEIDYHESLRKNDDCIMAFGADLKNTVSYAKKDRILTTHYIADLDNEISLLSHHGDICKRYEELFCLRPNVIVRDMHPGYASVNMAKERSGEQIELQHHFAHIYSVMAENGLNKAIGASFDGTGYGLDGAIWGGEFIEIKGSRPVRAGHLSYVKLVGGDEAAKNASQTMNCYISECLLNGLIQEKDVKMTGKLSFIMAAQKSSTGIFKSSSMGRLFDAISALLGICDYNSYEGECAINLEKAAWEYLDKLGNEKEERVPTFELSMNYDEGECSFTIDQLGLFKNVLLCYNTNDYDNGAIALGFHRAVVEMIVKAFEHLRDVNDENKVCLSGGVFNNRLILTKTIDRLCDLGFEVFWNQKVPLGDGGISLGQAYYAMLLRNKIGE